MAPELGWSQKDAQHEVDLYRQRVEAIAAAEKTSTDSEAVAHLENVESVAPRQKLNNAS